MADTYVLREDQDGVCTLTLNRPNAYNALSIEAMDALADKLTQIAVDDSVRVVMIRGQGRGFCAGHDLKQIMASPEEEFHSLTFTRCSELMQQIVNLPVPVIAEVTGIATAAGCQLVASCDLAVAADNSRFATPGVNIGLFCSTPMVALSRTVAPKHALEMLYLGEMIDARHAEQMGLVNWVVPREELAAFTMDKARKIAAKSRATLTLGKRAYHAQKELPLAEAYAHCSKVMVENLQLEDAREGIEAFVEKRKPEWKHR